MKINSEKIKKKLKRLKITQDEFARDKLNMTRQGLGQILSREKTTFKTLNKIADVLGMDAKDLLK
ncbi:MAG: helix-turn-helix transcriptional regulator [Deltaproteobacteria bacterium]|nr:helix-turn-helix transcriptional regulator [Deltaproteobacteria bacterium]